MKEENPLVSIVIATYKRRKRLSRALSSLVDQSYKNLEIIIVDDNANEEWNLNVNEVLNSFKNENIIYIKNNKNLGSAKSRNIGISQSNGSYVTFLDDDDIYLNLKIERQLKEMIKDQSDYSITDLCLYDHNEQIIEYRSRDYIKKTSKEDLLKYHFLNHMTGTNTFMFTKKYLDLIGRFPEIDTGDEFYLMNSAILKEGKLSYIPYCDVKAYINPPGTGMSSDFNRIIGEKVLYNFKKEHFHLLDRKDKLYITMRFHLVLSYIYFNDKKSIFILYLIRSFISHPSGFFKLIMNRKL